AWLIRAFLPLGSLAMTSLTVRTLTKGIVVAPSPSAQLHAIDHQAHRIERRRPADIKHVAFIAAPGAIGYHFRHLDLADKGAIGLIAMDAVGSARPDAPL